MGWFFGVVQKYMPPARSSFDHVMDCDAELPTAAPAALVPRMAMRMRMNMKMTQVEMPEALKAFTGLTTHPIADLLAIIRFSQQNQK